MSDVRVTSAEFVKGIRGTNGILFNRMAQIAFIGRSNVGKSSVINALVGRKRLVKESSQPGKTTEINFFLINNNRYFVDLPGYGFAKLPEKKREGLRRMILWYLGELEIENRTVVLIIDAYVGPSEFDEEVLLLLERRGITTIIIANKFDKIKKSKERERKQALSEALSGRSYIPFSARTGEGKEELLSLIL
ncbi:MAG: ribosome biogenesis GTP-binding protein YihA/YsxC [Candidatus Paceibacterota bacterium]